MPEVQRELRMLVSHHEIGDYIEYGWFRGYVVGINAPQLQQVVRVEEVLRPAPGRCCGSTQRVPFNMGREYARPNQRNTSSCNRDEHSDTQRSASEASVHLPQS